ncbi:MAG TPA: DUF1592 domain-containing protein [Polyangia bacterium]|jgi:hypothetical protein
MSPKTFSNVRRLILACACLWGCSGEIGSPGGATAEPPGGGGGGNTGAGGGGIGSTTTPTDPGRVTMHRLNRAEYNNTVRDLIGTTTRPADTFTADNRGAGFDNIADLLSLAPVQLQLYEDAAEALSDEAMSTQRARIVKCDLSTGDACIRSTISAFGKQAWRRPLTDDEVTRFASLVTMATSGGDTADNGMKLAIQGLLLAPDFLFRVELDPDPASLTPHPLNNYEIASRISYFLWSSMPDDQLFAAADAGQLHDPAMLRAQVTRMLKDGKASALVDNFAGQWLYTRIIQDAAPDPTLFPMFDADLRTAMQQETELLFKDVVFAGTPTDQLITSNFTYLNDRLAQHYGLPAVGSKDMKKITLTTDQRGGFLGHGTILTSTSHTSRTSPVNRGKWVMNDLLCTDVPPPPGNVNTMLPATPPGATLRQQLEMHKEKACATCHVLMDPIGFGFENYDAVGAWRTTDNGLPVDSSGNYVDGKPFQGIHQLGSMIVGDAHFPACVASKVYTYALGRPPETAPTSLDSVVMANLAAGLKNGGFQFGTLLQDLVVSDTFLKRRGEPVAMGGSQ